MVYKSYRKTLTYDTLGYIIGFMKNLEGFGFIYTFGKIKNISEQKGPLYYIDMKEG